MGKVISSINMIILFITCWIRSDGLKFSYNAKFFFKVEIFDCYKVYADNQRSDVVGGDSHYII